MVRRWAVVQSRAALSNTASTSCFKVSVMTLYGVQIKPCDQCDGVGCSQPWKRLRHPLGEVDVEECSFPVHSAAAAVEGQLFGRSPKGSQRSVEKEPHALDGRSGAWFRRPGWRSALEGVEGPAGHVRDVGDQRGVQSLVCTPRPCSSVDVSAFRRTVPFGGGRREAGP